MRACRRNYGLKSSQPFSAFKHARGTTYQDPFDGDTKAKDQMAWLVKKGDLVLSDKGNYSSVQICRRFGTEESKIFSTPLMANDDDDAPQGHLHNGKFDYPPLHTASDGSLELYEVTRLRYDLSDIPESDFEKLRITSRRGWYYHANLTFHLLITDSVTFWVTLREKELARVTVAYT